MTGITAIVYEIAIYFFSHCTTREWPALGIKLSFWGTVTNIIGMQSGWAFKDYRVYSVTWYVSVLLLCYIILFFMHWLTERWNIPVVYLSFGMIMFGVGIISYKINVPFFNAFTGRGFYSFFLGALIAHRPPEVLLLVTRVIKCASSCLHSNYIQIFTCKR